MAASGSSPASAAPVVHAAVDSLPALAAPESPRLRYTLADALQYKDKINNRPSSIGRIHEVRIQVRKKGNAATHYYRKLFTLKDGTPLVKFLDFSHAERCKIMCIGLEDVSRDRYWEFRHDNIAVFKWKALIAVGLTDAQLVAFLHYPITSVKFVPSRIMYVMSNPISPQPRNLVSGHDVMDVPTTVNWSWIFEREDGSWIALEPGLAGKKMMFQIEGRAAHPRYTGIVPTPRPHPAHSHQDNDLIAEASWERVWERRLAILYGGLEETVWRRHMVEELSSGRFRPIVELHRDGWFHNDPIAATIDAWLTWEFERASGNPYEQHLLPIQIPSGATAIVQPLDSAQPSLTQTPALAADIEETTGPWDMGTDSEEELLMNLAVRRMFPGPWTLDSGDEEELLLNLDDASAMSEEQLRQWVFGPRANRHRRVPRSSSPVTTTSPHPLIHPQGEPQDSQWGAWGAR